MSNYSDLLLCIFLILVCLSPTLLSTSKPVILSTQFILNTSVVPHLKGNIMDNFTVEYQIHWSFCVAVCTDDDCSLSHYYSGLQALICTRFSDTEWNYSII